MRRLLVWPLLAIVFVVGASLVVVGGLVGIVVGALGWVLRWTGLPGLHWLGHVIGDGMNAAADRVLATKQRYDAWVAAR